jgi:hypothetical protein
LPGFFGPYPSAIRDESRCRIVMRLLTKTLQYVAYACQGSEWLAIEIAPGWRQAAARFGYACRLRGLGRSAE